MSISLPDNLYFSGELLRPLGRPSTTPSAFFLANASLVRWMMHQRQPSGMPEIQSFFCSKPRAALISPYVEYLNRMTDGLPQAETKIKSIENWAIDVIVALVVEGAESLTRVTDEHLQSGQLSVATGATHAIMLYLYTIVTFHTALDRPPHGAVGLLTQTVDALRVHAIGHAQMRGGKLTDGEGMSRHSAAEGPQHDEYPTQKVKSRRHGTI